MFACKVQRHYSYEAPWDRTEAEGVVLVCSQVRLELVRSVRSSFPLEYTIDHRTVIRLISEMLLHMALEFILAIETCLFGLAVEMRTGIWLVVLPTVR